MVVANPIYDTVFKFLMEDERIARTILSALLKMDIIRVELQPDTIQRSLRDALSVCRLCFTARLDDHNKKSCSISFLKTRHPHEIISLFPLQQSDILIYLLGQKVENVKNPVVDIENCPIDNLKGKKGIIIQIPRIQYVADNRQNMILSIFSQAYQHEQHVISISESNYSSDIEVLRVLQRLQEIALNIDMRMDMNCEDEFFWHLSKQYKQNRYASQKS
ncbi:MAG: hypothetical protein IJ185_07925 [Prevotella sp.]|nr:hypothetical protein [Prevotella sp.]